MSTDMIKTEGTALSLFSADGFELVQRMAKAFARRCSCRGAAGIARIALTARHGASMRASRLMRRCRLK